MPIRPYETTVIVTDSFVQLYYSLDLKETSKTISYNMKAIGLVSYDIEYMEELDELFTGILDIIDVVYPIRENYTPGN